MAAILIIQQPLRPSSCPTHFENKVLVPEKTADNDKVRYPPLETFRLHMRQHDIVDPRFESEGSKLSTSPCILAFIVHHSVSDMPQLGSTSISPLTYKNQLTIVRSRRSILQAPPV
jgi:hypothetical protein